MALYALIDEVKITTYKRPIQPTLLFKSQIIMGNFKTYVSFRMGNKRYINNPKVKT